MAIFKMKSAYNENMDYIGDWETADHLEEMGITSPEKRTPDSDVCSIGKSEKDGKWYGWSHRAIHGFQIGSTVKEGDCGFCPDKGEWTAETEEDAKQMAKDFAEGVS